MAEQKEIKDLKGIIRRRKKSFIITFLLIFISAGTISLVLPPIYRSESTILIEEQQIPKDYVKSSITGYVEERLQTITQRIMRRTKLMEIIDQFNLYSGLRSKYPVEKIIEKMRKDINLETISADVMDRRTGRPSVATIAFSLSYQGKEPSTIQKVANRLASLYVEEELRARERVASSTTVFLKEELDQLKKQIYLIEDQISEFKKAHMGELPEYNEINLQAIVRLDREVGQINMQIRSLQERKVYLKGQIANVDPLTPVVTEEGKTLAHPKERLKRLRLQLISLQSTLSEKHPDIKKLKREINELEAQVGKSDHSAAKVRKLNDLEGVLAALKGKLGPRHPDVIKLSREVKVLSKEVDTLAKEKARIEVAEEKPDNPAFINLMTQVASTDMEIKSLLQEKKKIKQTLAEYQRRIENAPLVEKKYKFLTRDYENAKDKYNEIMNKLMEARVAQGMEQTQRGERFTIAESAQLPEKPYKPNRIAIVLLGFVLALGGGVGLAAALESTDDSVKTADELNNVTGLPVFSLISLIETNEERRGRRIRIVLLILAIIGLIVVALMHVNRFIMPLELFWIKIQHRVMGLLI